MGGEDRDLRFGMRRVLRDELLAQDDEEAEAYVHHGTEDAGDVGEAGGVHGRGKGSRGRGLCLRARGESYLIHCEPPGLQLCFETGDVLPVKHGLPGGGRSPLPPSRGESGSRPWRRRFRGFNA